MKFFKLMHRGVALLLLLAMIFSLVPNVFAGEQGATDGDIVIEVPEELKNEDVVVASFGEDGKIVYETASDEVRGAINGGLVEDTYADVTDMKTNRAGTDFAAGQRLAFFIDPANSEGNSNYTSYTLTATIIKNLVAAGVTDLFVMTKTRAGSFSTTNLSLAISNKGSAKVYAWMHCARDDAYLKSNKSAAQYHFRAGYNNSQNGGDDSVTGFVHLGNADYITYMEGLMTKVSTAGADGILLDSVRFGSEYMGWDNDAKAYMGQTNWNNAVKAMCATAYTVGGSTYRYTAETSGTYAGYYKYVSSGGSTNTSGDTLETIITNATDAAKSFGNYRKSVITNFIGKMKTAFGSSKIITVALERDWVNTNYYKYVKGQDPYNFRNHVKKGFCVTMQVADNHTTNPVTIAKKVAYYTNVMIGIDFYKVGTYGNYGYTYPDTIVDLAESIYTARYDVNGAYNTYRGCILGAACYTAGYVGAMKVVLSGSGASPTLTATVAHPNQKTTAMMAYFNAHGDTDCGTQTTDGSLLQPSGSTMQYFANKNSSGNGAYGYIGAYSSYTGATVSAFGSATIVVALKNYSVDWDKLPFARIAFYVPSSLSTTADTVGHFPIYFIKGHETCTSFTDTTLVTATCTTVGYKRRTCKTCGYDYIEEVAKLGHSYTSAVTTQPTCENAGVKTYTCSRCSGSYTEAIAALGHSYSTVVTAPTCTTDGYTTYTCATCNNIYQADAVVSPGHAYVADVLEATCTTDGYTTYTCSVCNDSYVGDNVDALGHNYQSVVTEPSCTEGGYTVVTCSGCGDTYVENIVSAHGHDYGEGNVAVQSTCTEEGVIVFSCAYCDDSYIESLPLAGHTYFSETTEVTCTTDGYTVYTCGDCGYSYTGDVIVALGHDYTAIKTEATCFDDGYTTYTCSNCGDNYISDYVESPGHRYNVEVIAPTCTESGYSIFTCVCNDSFVANYVDPNGHTISYTDNGETHTATCSVCDYSVVEEHELVNYTCVNCNAFCCKHEQTGVVVDVEATCTTDGSQRTVCDLCGNTLLTETVEATGHEKYKVAAKAATCTQSGHREYWTCSNCNGIYADETFAYEIPEYYIQIAATGHSYRAEVTEPTCTEAGYTTYVCSACGDSYVMDETEAYGHSYEAVVTVPICTEAGFTTYTCSVCGDTYITDELEANGHSYTYTDNGEDHTVACTNCDYSVSEAHSFVDGTCICGAVESTEPTYAPNSNLTLTMSISVGAEMQVMYTIVNSKVKNFESFYLEVVKKVVGGESVTTIFSLDNGNLTSATNASGAISRYTATYTGIFAMEMGDEFTATLYAVEADGTINYGPSESSSIKTFLMGRLADETATAEVKTLAVDMLNYGAAAQINFGYDVENLVNADLTEEQKALGTQTIPEAVDGSSATGEGVAVVTSVSVQSKIMLYLTFRYRASADSDLKVVIKDSEGKVLSEYAPYQINTANCKAIYDNVGARQMRELITIELYDNDVLVSQSITWSVESYVAQTRANTSESEAKINAVNAMLAYGDSAAAYLESTGQ